MGRGEAVNGWPLVWRPKKGAGDDGKGKFMRMSQADRPKERPQLTEEDSIRKEVHRGQRRE